MKNGGKKKKLIIPIILIFFIIAIVVGYQFGIKPSKIKEQETEKLRNTTETMMQAYMKKDLPQALLHTDLKEHADDFGEYLEGYFYDYIEDTTQMSSLAVTMFQCNDNWGNFLEDVMLNIVRTYEIEEIAVEDDNAIIKMELTVADISQVKLEGDMSEILSVLNGVVSVNSIFTDILTEPTVDTVLGGVEEYIANMMDEAFVLFNNKVIESDDKKVSLMLHAHKEDDVWIIEVDDKLKEFLQN